MNKDKDNFNTVVNKEIITKKVSQKTKDNISTMPIGKIEQKIDEVEEKITYNIDNLEQKFTLLKEQIAKCSHLMEESEFQLEKIKKKNIYEIKEFEVKVKGMLEEEKDYLNKYIENAVNKVEVMIGNYNINAKKDNQLINNVIEEMNIFLNVCIAIIYIYIFIF